METEPIKRSHSAHRKRRERAHQLQLEKLSKSDDESAEDDKDPNSAGKDRGRSRPRKKRSGAGTYEEDIIDGFAIVSFKTVDDLEVRGCVFRAHSSINNVHDVRKGPCFSLHLHYDLVCLHMPIMTAYESKTECISHYNALHYPHY